MREVRRDDHRRTLVEQRRQSLRHPPGDLGVGFVTDQYRNDHDVWRDHLEERQLDLEAVFRSMRVGRPVEVGDLTQQLNRRPIHAHLTERGRKTLHARSRQRSAEKRLVVRWPEEDHPTQTLGIEGRECRSRHLSRKGIAGVRNDQRPSVPLQRETPSAPVRPRSEDVWGHRCRNCRRRPAAGCAALTVADIAATTCDEESSHTLSDKPCEARLQSFSSESLRTLSYLELEINGSLCELSRLSIIAFEPREPGQGEVDLRLPAVPPAGPPEVLARLLEFAAHHFGIGHRDQSERIAGRLRGRAHGGIGLLDPALLAVDLGQIDKRRGVSGFDLERTLESVKGSLAVCRDARGRRRD